MVNTNILALKLAALAFPVLKSWGFPLVQVPVILHKGNLPELLQALHISKPLAFTSFHRNASLKEALCSQYSELFIYCYDASPRAQQHVRFIESVIQTGFIDKAPLLAFPVIIAEAPLPDAVLSAPFYIEVEAVGPYANYQLSKLLPKDAELAAVEDVLLDYFDKPQNMTAELLKAALHFQYPRLHRSDCLNVLAAQLCEINRLVKRNRQMEDGTGVRELFIFALEKWASEQDTLRVCKLPEVSTEDIHGRSKTFFYTSEYLYISNPIFAEIAEILSKSFGINTLKRLLCDEGLLLSGSRRSYLSKMLVVCPDGTPKRLDRLKFDRTQLSEPGELDIIEKLGGN